MADQLVSSDPNYTPSAAAVPRIGAAMPGTAWPDVRHENEQDKGPTYDDLIKDPAGTIKQIGGILGKQASDPRTWLSLVAMYFGPKVAEAAIPAIGRAATATTSAAGRGVGAAADVVDPDLVSIASPRLGALMRKAQQVRDYFTPKSSGSPSAPSTGSVADIGALNAQTQAARAARFGTEPTPPPAAAPPSAAPPTATPGPRTLNDAMAEAIAARRTPAAPSAAPPQTIQQSAAAAGDYLHGSSADFTEFKPGGHGAIYLSPTKGENILPGRATQAEAIAKGPFGGRLYQVAVDESKIKAFDPLNDPKAQEIYTRVIGQPSKTGLMPYTEMPALVKEAQAQGYNSFRVYEPSVQGVSRAITDPSALKVIRQEPISRGGTSAAPGSPTPPSASAQTVAQPPAAAPPASLQAMAALKQAGYSDPEIAQAGKWLAQGKSSAEVVKRIEAARAATSGASPFANLPTDLDVARDVSTRNATGKWPTK